MFPNMQIVVSSLPNHQSFYMELGIWILTGVTIGVILITVIITSYIMFRRYFTSAPPKCEGKT